MKLKLFLILATCLLVNCSNDSNNNTQSIIGKWESICELSGENSSEIVVYEFQNDGVIHTYAFKSEGLNCNSSGVLFAYNSGTYSIGNRVVTTTGELATELVIAIDIGLGTPTAIEGCYYIEEDTLMFGSYINEQYVLDREGFFLYKKIEE